MMTMTTMRTMTQCRVLKRQGSQSGVSGGKVFYKAVAVAVAA